MTDSARADGTDGAGDHVTDGAGDRVTDGAGDRVTGGAGDRVTGGARVGVDIGGTFTDVVVVADGHLRVHKTPSTPDAPEEGVVDGLGKARDAGLDMDAVDFLAHGTTVATNAVLEREWAETALVTTGGFRDALEIGRQARPDIYDFQQEKPDPVVPRHRRYGVPERLDERGNVLDALDEDAVRDLAAALPEDVESVAVSLLFSFENDAHERRVREILEAERPDASVSLSSAVLPEIREYERSLATALNAGLRPVMDRYLGRLDERVREAGVETRLRVMQSNGGIITAEAARERPVRALLSGPAAGVQGATHVARQCGRADVITMDMGGTSCDVSLVEAGDPLVTTDVEVGDYPVSVPMVDVHTVGAGGGSVAWLDAGGALRVGPRSAGADPGPACYGRGGTEPTITDAQLVLGRIDPAAFLSEVDPDPAAARETVERDVAEPMGTTVAEAAQGILAVANANMARALRVVSVERGYDPREFGLVAFGGAGPLHATALARELAVPEVVVPRAAGALSALGLLISDVVYDESVSRVRPWREVAPDGLAATFRTFEERGRERLAREDPDDRRFERYVDLRYEGQAFDLRVPVAPSPDDLDAAAMDDIAEAFHERHRRRYGHASPDEPVELVTVRLRSRGVVEPPDLRPEQVEGTVEDAVRETREVVFGGEGHETRVYVRGDLPTGSGFDGPAIVEGQESTVAVRPGQRARVDEYGNLRVSVEVDA